MNGLNLKPLDVDLKKYFLNSSCKIIGPKGDTISTILLNHPNHSVLGTKWVVPKDASGGTYKVLIEFDGHGLPSSERSFDVRAFQNKRLNTQIEFLRKGYGAGDMVFALLTVSRAEGGIPEGASINFKARVDGKEVFTGETKLPKSGTANIKFDLPAQQLLDLKILTDKEFKEKYNQTKEEFQTGRKSKKKEDDKIIKQKKR